jgi:hypothetical protein
VAGPPGTLVGALLVVRRGAGDPDTSSRVGIDAKTDDRNAWSSHRDLTPLGSTSVSRLNVSPVIPRIATSSSALVKSVPGPHVILQQSFGPVYMQAILDRCCRGAIHRFRKSPSTIRDVRPPFTRFLTRFRTRTSPSGSDGLAFQVLRSLWGLSVGNSRRSLGPSSAMTQLSCQSSHLALEKTLM